MNIPRTAALLTLVCALALAAAAEAQQRAPRRPRLGNDADTNDAALYYQYALERMERNTDQALAGFYWAARLDPTSPMPLYGQWATTLLASPTLLVKYVQRDRRTLASRDVIQLDSLRLRAEMIDPFYHRISEGTILMVYARQANRVEGDPFNTGGRQAGSVGGSDVSANRTVMSAAERYFEQTDPYSRGGLAYGAPDLRLALQYWAQALRSNSIDWIWADRARAFFELRQYDSAMANLANALDTRRSSTAEMDRRPWEKRSHWQYMMGRIYEQRRDAANARAAYEVAVDMDNDQYPSVLRMAQLTLDARDTVTAAGGFIRVAEHPQASFQAITAAGAGLIQCRRPDAAITAMRRATTLEPAASAGWLVLARASEAARDTAAAIAAYERYMALAPQADAPRIAVTRSLAMLRPAGQ